MVLLKTALKSLYKNKVMNLITVLQLICTLFVATVMVSSLWIRFQYYQPFQDVFQSKGFMLHYYLPAEKTDGIGTQASFLDSERFQKIFPKIHKIYSCHGTMIYSPEDNHPFLSISYDDNLLDRIKPPLISGRWLTVTNDSTQVEVVVSQNDYGWRVGDVIKLNAMNFPTPISFTAKIVGIMSNGARIFGAGNNSTQGTESCNTLFHPYSLEIEEKPIMLFSKSALCHIHTGTKLGNEDLEEIIQALQYDTLITVDVNTTEQEMQEMEKKFSDYGLVNCQRMERINENSRKYIFEQVRMMFPIVIILLLLTVTSSISSSALSTDRRLHDYSTFYLLGLQWKYCSFVNLLQSLVLAVISATITCIIIFFSQLLPMQVHIRPVR